jgi:hypothetical protein
MEKDINKTKKDLKKPSSVKSVINTNPQLPGVVENGPAVAKTPLAEKILRLSGKVKSRNESTQFKMSQENVDLLIDAVLTENLDDKIEKLLRVGLGDINKISMYRKALSDPDAAVKTTVLRKYIVDVLDKLLDIIEDDNVLYQRLLANLMKRKSMKECAITVALKKKSEKFDYDFETLAEVYYRGVQSWDKTTGTTPVQFGFNRVNSFVNNGRAYRLDEDLVVRDKAHTTSAGFKAQVRHEPGKPAKFVRRNTGEIKINEANPAIETEPKLKKKTVNREIYGVNRKSQDPMSEGNVDPKKRFIGTKSLTDTYKKDTPGEKLKETTTGGFDKKINVADVPVRLITGKIKRLPPAKSSSSKGGD